MILKNLTSMYPSLYDLFNQNFRKIGEDNYARIALGDSNTQNYFVNNKFRCIVLLDKTEIDQQDPPFINRFEKHIITFEYLLNENEVKMSKQIYNLFQTLIESDLKEIKNDLNYQLINCDLEEIQGIFYQVSEKVKKGNNSLFKNNESKKITNLNIYKEKIFNKIIPTFSQDIIFFSKYSNFGQKYKEELNNIISIYFNKKYQHTNLKSFLESIQSEKHIIYTFSNILDYILDINVKNKEYNNFSSNNTMNIFVERINSEREVDEHISNFYSSDNYNLCIFHFDIYDCIHLNHINYLIEAKEEMIKNGQKIDHSEIEILNLEGQNNKNSLKNDTFNDIINLQKEEEEETSKEKKASKVILFIIHLERKTTMKNDLKIHNEYLISHLTKWNQIFIDNLNGKNIDLKRVFESSNEDLFNNSDLINLDEEFSKYLYHAFSSISFNIKINFSDISDDEYNEKVCQYINNDEELKSQIQKVIKNKIKNIEEPILKTISRDYNFEENDVDFISALIKYMKSLYNSILTDTLIQFEKENILSTKLLCSPEMRNKYFNDIYEKKINALNNKIENFASFSQNIKIDKILGVSYPFISNVFFEINNYINTFLENYKENDNKYRYEEFDEKKEYFDIKNNHEINLKKEFEKKYFFELFNDDKNNLNVQKLQQILFNDYIIYYLSKSNEKFSNKDILLFFVELYKLFLSNKEEDNDDNKEKEGFNEEDININIYSLGNISKFVLFLESYNQYIYSLIKFICIMNSYIKDFIKDFTKLISSKLFKSTHKEISYVNDIFVNIFE